MNTLIAIAAAGAMAATPFSLSSGDFHNGGPIALTNAYNSYGCTGKNISPSLHWKGAPPATKSFVLTVWDPDAPVRGGWWHWVLFDIPASTISLAAGAGSTNLGAAPPASVEGTTTFGKAGYGGPCPPIGNPAHHYIFTLYALDEARVSGATQKTTGPALTPLIIKHVLARTTLTGRFGRP